MADQILIKREAFPLPSEGQVQGVCVDVIDMGEKVEQFMQQPAIVVRKAVVVWQLAETNPDTDKPFEVSKEFTVSFGKKANLRKFLASWRGKDYTDAEAAEGVPLHKLETRNGILTIQHKTSGSGNTYAVVSNITPLLKGIQPLKASTYERAEYWAKRKQEYAEAVAKHRDESAPSAPREVAEVLGDDWDNLPF